jgi:ribosome-associated protein
MEKTVLTGRDFGPELLLTASRSRGPGGQHVNKVSTKVELRFDIPGSIQLLPEEKSILLAKLGKRVNKEGILVIVSEDERSQLKNRKKVIERFYELLEKALKPVKKRRKTRPTAASVENRLTKKRMVSEKKVRRKNPPGTSHT